MLDCRPLVEPPRPRRAGRGRNSTRTTARSPKPSRRRHRNAGVRRRPPSLPRPGAPGGRFTRTNGSEPAAAAAAQAASLKKLRLALVLLGLSVLALISTVFGMLMAVASDLPALENRAEYNAAKNSVLFAGLTGCKESDTDDCRRSPA